MTNIVDILEEIKEYCKEMKKCDNCFYCINDYYCFFGNERPCDWETDELT